MIKGYAKQKQGVGRPVGAIKAVDPGEKQASGEQACAVTTPRNRGAPKDDPSPKAHTALQQGRGPSNASIKASVPMFEEINNR
jgi:hypothetical protein